MERRRDPRFRPVELSVDLLEPNGSTELDLQDISKGGVCLLADEPLPVGSHQRIRLALDLGKGRQNPALDLAIRVVWCTELDDEYQVGAAFDLAPQQRQQLEALLRLSTREVAEIDGELRFRDDGGEPR